MFGRKKTRPTPDVNLLELVPEQLVDSTRDDEGIITILGPRFKTGFMKKLVGSRLKSPYFKIALDDIGTTVWENIDGTQNIGKISDILKEKFGEKIEPVNNRLAMFFTQLEMSRFIVYTNLEEVKAKGRPAEPEDPTETPAD
jgi:hypothetical protein